MDLLYYYFSSSSNCGGIVRVKSDLVFPMFNLEHKPLQAASVLARHGEGTPVPQHLSELELKEIQHRGTFSLTSLPPDKPLFRYFQCFINVPFSVSGKHLFEAHLPPDLWQTLWQGESFWHPESATTFVTVVPVLPPSSFCLTLSDSQLCMCL